MSNHEDLTPRQRYRHRRFITGAELAIHLGVPVIVEHDCALVVPEVWMLRQGETDFEEFDDSRIVSSDGHAVYVFALPGTPDDFPTHPIVRGSTQPWAFVPREAMEDPAVAEALATDDGAFIVERLDVERDSTPSVDMPGRIDWEGHGL